MDRDTGAGHETRAGKTNVVIDKDGVGLAGHDMRLVTHNVG